LVGLGAEIRVRRVRSEVAVYLQDTDSGAVVVIRRSVPDPSDGSPPRSFRELGRLAGPGGVSLAELGAGQLLVKGGRRLPDGEFVIGRARASFNPQAFAWESLRQPLVVDGFRELAARLATRSPAAIGPRRHSEGLCVCAISAVRDGRFDPVEQAVRATLVDPYGATATLDHPYTSRGAGGAEALLRLLAPDGRPAHARFVAGRATLRRSDVIIRPISVVYQEGAARRMLQPWVAQDVEGGTADGARDGSAVSPAKDRLSDYWDEVTAALGDLVTTGVRHSAPDVERRWWGLARDGASLGFARLLGPVERLAEALPERHHVLAWDDGTAVAAALDLAGLVLLVEPALLAIA
jgi:hypothetical protein